MIAYLSGKITSKQEKSLILETHGVGYLVHVAKSLAEKTEEGSPISLHIHTHVREDILALYGFESAEQWHFFGLLLTVSGIGPKSALEILDAPIARVKQAIAKKDAAYLTKIPGIGRKTAERIIVDLQSKIKETLMMEDTEEKMAGEDIINALMSLGYQRQQVINGLRKIPQELTNEEAIIKYFLQNI